MFPTIRLSRDFALIYTTGCTGYNVATFEIVRRVRVQGATVQITYHGKVIAQLVRVRPPNALNRADVEQLIQSLK